MSTARCAFISSVMRRKMEDALVRVQRKVFRLQLFRHLRVSSIIQQNRAENRLFSVYVGRQTRIEAEIGDGGHTSKCRPNRSPNRHVNRRRVVWESGEQIAGGERRAAI